MRTPGRITAAIEVLTDFDTRRIPLKNALADWGRNNRYAGSKDRAWISGLCLDVLRRRNSLSLIMDGAAPRLLVLGALRYLWRFDAEKISEAVVEEHGPGALSDDEQAHLSFDEPLTHLAQQGSSDKEISSSFPDRFNEPALFKIGDYPEWMQPMMARVFDKEQHECAALSERADIDLRINTLKTTPEKALQALKTVKAGSVPAMRLAARIDAPDPSEKAPAVTVIPAFNKGWVEVQDLGSQIAAAAAGDIKGKQVLDYCAGAGGKTLALAAMMKNTGQLHAWDIDARRLKPLFHRAKRAGVRNLQIRSPAGGDGIDDLAGKMDVVFVDAPCTGSGTWRRHPDTKWRLTEKQLGRRMKEQDEVLAQAVRFVKPGGRLVYVTCSIFKEENEDRVVKFLEAHSQVSFRPVLDDIMASGLIPDTERPSFEKHVTDDGALRLTPYRMRADGFYIASFLCA